MTQHALTPAADPQWPDPVEIHNPDGRSPIVLLCEHASNHIPAEYAGLGISQADLQRHIAWDIGAAEVTRRLSSILDAPAFLGTYSRLLIDLNRPLDSPTSIVERSEATDILGNSALSQAERERRVRRIFQPYQDAVSAHLDARAAVARPAVIVPIHSFTPVFHGEARPWHAGVLFEKATAFAQATIERLSRDATLNVGANVPYGISVENYYALLVHGDNVDRPALLIEIRQDLIATAEDAELWARRLAAALAADVALAR